MTIILSGLLLALFVGKMLDVFFSPRFICHICEDEKKKMSLIEYEAHAGVHKHCGEKYQL